MPQFVLSSDTASLVERLFATEVWWETAHPFMHMNAFALCHHWKLEEGHQNFYKLYLEESTWVAVVEVIPKNWVLPSDMKLEEAKT